MRRMVVTAAVIAAGFMHTQAAYADDGFTGNKVWQLCQMGEESSAMTACGIFVAGVMDGALNAAVATKSPRVYCAPEGVTYRQGRDIFIKALAEKPEIRHLPAAAIVLMALKHAYPCPSPIADRKAKPSY